MSKSDETRMTVNFTEQRVCLRRQEGLQKFRNMPAVIRRLDMGDFDKVTAFHKKIVGSTSRELFAPTSDEDLGRILSGYGIGLGVECEGELVCMRLVIAGAHVELPEEMANSKTVQEERACFTEHCIVDKDFRGDNLQFLTYYLMENLLFDYFDVIYTTVSPLNVFSLRNIIQCGFYVFDLRECYANNMRFVLRKGFRYRVTLDTTSYSRARVTDYERQKNILAQKKYGYRMNHNTAGSWMLYAPAFA